MDITEEERGCDVHVRSPLSWGNTTVLRNTLPNASSSVVLADGHWTLLGRAKLALVPLLTHIYLLSQKQMCQSLKQRWGRANECIFFFFADDVICNMVTSELLSLLLKGILFWFGLFLFVWFGFLLLFLVFGSLTAPSPSTGSPASSVSSLGSRWGQLPTLEVEGSFGTLLC